MQSVSEWDTREILRSILPWLRRYGWIIPLPVSLCVLGVREIHTQTCVGDCASPTIDGLYFIGLGSVLLGLSFLGSHWQRMEALRNALTDDERLARYRVREALQFLADVLLAFNEPAAKHVLSCVKKHPQQVADDGALWGASGSLLDWIQRNNRGPSRVELEEAFLELGLALLAAGVASADVERWVARLRGGPARDFHGV